MTAKEDLFKLKDPNHHEAIGIIPKWRVGDSAGSGQNEIYPFYDADQCEEILDDVCGVGGWGCEYREVAGALFCSISINVDGDIIEKADAGGERTARKSSMSDDEKKAFRDKSAASGAFVRAAAKWGIGRHLSLLPKISLKNAGSGVMVAPDGVQLRTPAELSAWCNKITPSMRYLITIYQINKQHFDENKDASSMLSNMKNFLKSLS